MSGFAYFSGVEILKLGGLPEGKGSAELCACLRDEREERLSGALVQHPGAFPDFPVPVRRGEANMLKRMGILVLAAIIGVFCLEVGEKMSIPGVSGVVSPAHAVIGRPGTPRSVAGVARRTYRRCATGVYRC
jgi:hypothetical protein